MSTRLAATIGNDAWMRANAEKLRMALPEDWAPVDSGLMLRVGFAIKVAGVEWYSQDELARCMEFFRITGLMEFRGSPKAGTGQVRRRQEAFA